MTRVQRSSRASHQPKRAVDEIFELHSARTPVDHVVSSQQKFRFVARVYRSSSWTLFRILCDIIKSCAPPGCWCVSLRWGLASRSTLADHHTSARGPWIDPRARVATGPPSRPKRPSRAPPRLSPPAPPWAAKSPRRPLPRASPRPRRARSPSTRRGRATTCVLPPRDPITSRRLVRDRPSPRARRRVRPRPPP